MRRVVVLAPMPLEMDAITTAFGLSPTSDAKGAPWTGRVGESEVTAIHIGMGPPLTRAAVNRVLDEGGVDHIMNAGICGGLDPELPVGTLINPEVLVLQSTGGRYLHKPPGDVPLSGMLTTAEEVTFDIGLSKRLFAEGFIAVDMESAAVPVVGVPLHRRPLLRRPPRPPAGVDDQPGRLGQPGGDRTPPRRRTRPHGE